MSKFVSYFPIGSMSGDSAYLGLAPDSVKGRVISTLDQNIVYRIELSSQKTIQSWTSEQKFSHKVVYDFKSGKYVGIFGNQKLVSWGEGTTKIEKGKIKLPRMLKDIVSFDNKHTILVYKDGTCESLESRENGCNVQCKPVISPQTHQISQIACFNTRDNRVMLTYFVNSRRNRGKLELVYFLLNDDDLTPSRSNDNVARVKRIEITNDEQTLSGYTVVDGDTFPSVIKIGLDKRIYMLPLNCDENAPSGFGAHNATFNYLRVDKPLTVINVSPNCIAIYGGNAKKDGASLILYNTVHFTVVCVQEFKVHLNNCRLWSIGKRILMADGHQLSCVLFSMSQGKLSEVIGSKRSNEWDHKVNKDGVSEEYSLVEVTSFVDGAARVIDTSPNLTLNKKMFRRDAIPTAIFEDVEKNIGRMTRFDIPIEFVDGVDHDLKVRTFVHPKDELYAYNQNRILSDFLENGGASEIEITEHHIQILIKAKASSELVKCLRKYTNVSERMLVKCLKYFLSMADDDEKLTNINVLFTCSFDSKLIVNHLSTDLNLDDAIYLLDVIHRNLVDDEFSLEEAPQFGQRFDGDMALINWFVVILEAHYSNFLLSRDPNLNQFLSNWKELIETFVSDIRSLKEVDAKLLSLVNGKFKRNDNTSSKWYSVERVKLY